MSAPGPRACRAAPRRWAVAFAVVGGALLATGPAVAQAPNAGPFIPLGAPLDRLVTWALDAGALPSLDPLQRPYRMAAVRTALTADTAGLPASARRAVRWVREALAAVDVPAILNGEVGASSYRNGRRDSFRPGGGGGVHLLSGEWASLTEGAAVAVVNIGLDGRLWDDPQYTGTKEKRVAGGVETAYVAFTGRQGDLFFGREARNWGPSLFEGLLVSPSAYNPIDELAGSLRIGRFELTSLAQRLDDGAPVDSAPGVPYHRYLFAHRLGISLGRQAWLALMEAGVYGGPARGFEPTLMAPLNVALLSEWNDSQRVNIMFGADMAARLSSRLGLAASLYIDDIQIDRQVLTDQRPTSYGLTATLVYSLPDRPVQVHLGYTRVSSLAYRNSFDPQLMYARSGVGMARDFADYDQTLLRIEVRPTPALYLALDASYIRQGSGDFRSPFPNDTVLAGPGQSFLVAPVHAALGGRLTVDAEVRPGVELRAEAGLTGNFAGGTQAIANLGVHIRFDLLHPALRTTFPGVSLAADRGWP